MKKTSSYKDVFMLQIPKNNVIRMQKAETLENFCCEKNDGRFWDSTFVSIHIAKKITSFSIVHRLNEKINRYRRELETYPQAKTPKNGREYFLLFFSDASKRRV